MKTSDRQPAVAALENNSPDSIPSAPALIAATNEALVFSAVSTLADSPTSTSSQRTIGSRSLTQYKCPSSYDSLPTYTTVTPAFWNVNDFAVRLGDLLLDVLNGERGGCARPDIECWERGRFKVLTESR
jgi:hypothetical protein